MFKITETFKKELASCIDEKMVIYKELEKVIFN